VWEYGEFREDTGGMLLANAIECLEGFLQKGQLDVVGWSWKNRTLIRRFSGKLTPNMKT
jgi:hypothetical protein